MAREYLYGGARALVELHERHQREFFGVWRRAESASLALPVTDDPDYASRAALLAHVLGAAGRYLVWICEKLELPQPALDPPVEPETFVLRAAGYLEEVLAAWDGPLVGLTEEVAYGSVHASNWGPPFCIDAMLEHAVMHPIRHAHQLRRLMDH